MPDLNKNGKMDAEEEVLEEILMESLSESNTKSRPGMIVLVIAAALAVIALLVFLFKVV